jgi:hypothetical protein
MRALIIAVSLTLSSAACQSAGMEPVVHQQVEVAPSTSRSPYEIELVDAAGRTLPTYAHRGRFYVEGAVGERYGIRVRNPTASRIEAVVSVDGLDVIDGEMASTGKRGYVIAPYADVTITGFRVSTQAVAAFRFSSVSRSYAGRKGVARNVGVIGVAVFAERRSEPLILPDSPVASRDRHSDYDDGYRGGDRGGAGESREAPPPTPRSSRRPSVGAADEAESAPSAEPCCGPRHRPTERPGLGTEFGERRHSAVGFTRFERAHQSTPTAYAELRYNDGAGLAALGIDVRGIISEDELHTRETADPFPGQRFSEPPR